MAAGAHLYEPQRVIPLLTAKVVVAESQRFLENGVVDFGHDGHQHTHVVTHVVASELIRSIGQSLGVRVIR